MNKKKQKNFIHIISVILNEVKDPRFLLPTHQPPPNIIQSNEQSFFASFCSQKEESSFPLRFVAAQTTGN